MRIFLFSLILAINNLSAQEVTRGQIKTLECSSEEMTTCTEEFLVQDQIFIDKYGGKGKKSGRQTVQLKN